MFGQLKMSKDTIHSMKVERYDDRLFKLDVGFRSSNVVSKKLQRFSDVGTAKDIEQHLRSTDKELEMGAVNFKAGLDYGKLKQKIRSLIQ